MVLANFAGIFVSLIFIIFFAGAEIAYTAASKISIELGRKRGNLSGKFWTATDADPSRFFTACIIGFCASLISFVFFTSALANPVWQWVRLQLPNISDMAIAGTRLLGDVIICGIILVFILNVTRSYFRVKNHLLLASNTYAFIINLFTSVVGLLGLLLLKAANWILVYLFNQKDTGRLEVPAKTDIDKFSQNIKTLHEEDSTELNKEMFQNALEISDTKLRECLVPRREIIRIDVQESIEAVKQKFIETKLSKLVVYDGNIDHILGYVHHLDLFKHPATVQDMLIKIPVVPDSMSATDMMARFGQERKSMAWVIDEFGGTAGIITMEDLLEEIFGEIKDEYDEAEEFIEKQIADDEFILSGRLELDYITDKFNIEFDGDIEAETLSGYIIEMNNGIPEKNERVIINRHEYSILNVADTRIETVKLKII